MSKQTFLFSARRTPIVPQGGAYKDIPIHGLAAPVLLACLEDAGFEGDLVDEVILSNALGAGGNPARSAVLAAGLPERIAGLSIDRQCAGGLDAILIAKAMVNADIADLVLAGGVESFSLRPRRLYRTTHDSPFLEREQAPFTPWQENGQGNDPPMHEAAADLARQYYISKERQDQWAKRSHANALKAVDFLQPLFAHPEGVKLASDPFARSLSDIHCRRARVLCDSVTVANTSVAADGAAFVLVGSEKMVKHCQSPSFRLVDGITLGGSPNLPGLAPIAAIRHVLANAKLKPEQLVGSEIMEAYAAQVIACVEGANLNADIVNCYGGALARGHPIGASGAILAVQLYGQFSNLSHSSGSSPHYGLAAIAAAGGLGSALLVEV